MPSCRRRTDQPLPVDGTGCDAVTTRESPRLTRQLAVRCLGDCKMLLPQTHTAGRARHRACFDNGRSGGELLLAKGKDIPAGLHRAPPDMHARLHPHSLHLRTISSSDFSAHRPSFDTTQRHSGRVGAMNSPGQASVAPRTTRTDTSIVRRISAGGRPWAVGQVA